ncbi:MAG: trypsin-like peptidase domain-containing protein [Dehalococcoidia bacterium]
MTDEPPVWARRTGTDRLDWATGKPDPGPSETEEGPPPGQPGAGRTAANRSLLLVAAVGFLAALIGGVAGGTVVAIVKDDSSAPLSATSPGENRTTAATRVDITSAISDAAATGRASVVRIESERRTGGQQITDVGSGVVIDAAGHIVTNAHVVLGTSSLRVFLADGTERQAFLIGHDAPFTDIAVLQIGLDGPPPLPVGDSSALQPGETVVAVGNPLSDFAGSVTVGVISGVNRVQVFDGVRNDDLIQTDAALNNGNSGGALLNLAGQFVGMPTAVLRESSSGLPVEGIGFAIPSNRLVAIAGEIIARGGALPRPSLGIDHADLTPEAAVRAGLPPGTGGAVVTAVNEGGPAGMAGIQPGYVVTRVGDYEVSFDEPLLNALMPHDPEQTVTVYLARNGQTIETRVRLGRRS